MGPSCMNLWLFYKRTARGRAVSGDRPRKVYFGSTSAGRSISSQIGSTKARSPRAQPSAGQAFSLAKWPDDSPLASLAPNPCYQGLET